MVVVNITTDPFDLSKYEQIITDDLIDTITNYFPVWPQNARIYHHQVSLTTDVTPTDEAGVEKLKTLDGTFYIVVYPGDPITIIVAVIAVVALIAVFLLMPKLPSAHQNVGSANNELSNRSNQARPNKRIPDIFGQVRSTPDLLAVPYREFVNANLEVEISYMCIGRGEYDIADIRDSDTPISSMAGAGVAFYGPYKVPGVDLPDLSIGSVITQPLYNVLKLNEVNGQSLIAPNSNSLRGDKDIRFVYPDTIQRNVGDPERAWTRFFAAGDMITVTNANFAGVDGTLTISESSRFHLDGTIEFATYDPSEAFIAGAFVTISNAGFVGDNGVGGYQYVDLSGIYEIDSSDSTTITLVDPNLVNSDWDLLDIYASDRTDYKNNVFSTPAGGGSSNLNGVYEVISVDSDEMILANPSLVNSNWENIDVQTNFISPTISNTSSRWVGPFIINLDDMEQVLCNFVAPQGMYKINEKGHQKYYEVTVQVELTPVNDDFLAIGPAENFYATVEGSGRSIDKASKNVSLWANPSFTGLCSVRSKRVTPLVENYDGSIVDEVKWRDCYGMAPFPEGNFGNITTIHSRTYATASATSVKERKLNCLVTRMIPQRNIDNTFGPTLIPSSSAADILCAAALDPYIGNRTVDELDVDGIYATVAEIGTYFGITDATEFAYTFDDDNISFEEIVQTIAAAVFCVAYRQGSKIKLDFEKETDDSILLFNHRNKLPNSETRTVTFGQIDDHDGVEVEYVSPDDDTTDTIYIPEDQSARNPRKIELTGVRSTEQATLHAYRSYNKIKYQNIATEFEATQEADVLVLNQRILVADGTRNDVFDGQIVSQDGLILELSQPFTPTDGVDYIIFIQHVAGFVESIEIVAGDDPRQVILANPPASPLSLDRENFAVATYQIVGNNEPRGNAFLMTEKNSKDNWTYSISAINYDARYYQNDKDFA